MKWPMDSLFYIFLLVLYYKPLMGIWCFVLKTYSEGFSLFALDQHGFLPISLGYACIQAACMYHASRWRSPRRVIFSVSNHVVPAQALWESSESLFWSVFRWLGGRGSGHRTGWREPKGGGWTGLLVWGEVSCRKAGNEQV